MGEISTDARMDRWVCPNDRQLALRAKLGAGWSVHTNKFSSFQRVQQLTIDEQEQIMNVIARADMLEEVEQERIGRLVEKLDNMKKNAMGNGSTQCVLCGDEFGLLGASPTFCDDCRKAVCTKCGVDTINCHKQPLWLCKICSENREVWKRSGAWFFKGLPKYTLPEKKADNSKQSNGKDLKSSNKGRSGSTRSYNTWSRGRGQASYGESSEHESEESSDDDVSIGKRKGRNGSESDGISLGSTQSGNLYTGHLRDSKSSITSANYGQGQLSATESSRGDDLQDETDNDSIGGYGTAPTVTRRHSSGYSSSHSTSHHSGNAASHYTGQHTGHGSSLHSGYSDYSTGHSGHPSSRSSHSAGQSGHSSGQSSQSTRQSRRYSEQSSYSTGHSSYPTEKSSRSTGQSSSQSSHSNGQSSHTTGQSRRSSGQSSHLTGETSRSGGQSGQSSTSSSSQYRRDSRSRQY